MKKTFWLVVVGLAVAFAIAIFLSPFASTDPDGLERVAEDKGFIEKAEETNPNAPLPDYTVPGVENEGMSTALAGGIGVVIVFGVGFATALLLRKKPDKSVN
jgi:cobalt/nickel transport protein